MNRQRVKEIFIRQKYRQIDEQIERERDLYKIQIYEDIYFRVMTDSYIDGQINKQRDRLTDRQVVRQIYRQDKWIDRLCSD